MSVGFVNIPNASVEDIIRRPRECIKRAYRLFSNIFPPGTPGSFCIILLSPETQLSYNTSKLEPRMVHIPIQDPNAWNIIDDFLITGIISNIQLIVTTRSDNIPHPIFHTFGKSTRLIPFEEPRPIEGNPINYGDVSFNNAAAGLILNDLLWFVTFLQSSILLSTHAGMLDIHQVVHPDESFFILKNQKFTNTKDIIIAVAKLNPLAIKYNDKNIDSSLQIIFWRCLKEPCWGEWVQNVQKIAQTRQKIKDRRNIIMEEMMEPIDRSDPRLQERPWIGAYPESLGYGQRGMRQLQLSADQINYLRNPPPPIPAALRMTRQEENEHEKEVERLRKRKRKHQ